MSLGKQTLPLAFIQIKTASMLFEQQFRAKELSI